jgi:hypothetical protein
MKNRKTHFMLGACAVLMLTTMAGCTPGPNQNVAPGQASGQGATSEDVVAICETVDKLRQGWFSGETMDDFTMHIPTLAAQLETIQGEDEEGVIVTARVLIDDLWTIERYLGTAPATEDENAQLTKAIDSFPLRSETVVNLCK